MTSAYIADGVESHMLCSGGTQPSRSRRLTELTGLVRPALSMLHVSRLQVKLMQQVELRLYYGGPNACLHVLGLFFTL